MAKNDKLPPHGCWLDQFEPIIPILRNNAPREIVQAGL
jgi:hypothetical protein